MLAFRITQKEDGGCRSCRNICVYFFNCAQPQTSSDLNRKNNSALFWGQSAAAFFFFLMLLFGVGGVLRDFLMQVKQERVKEKQVCVL